MDPSVPPRYYRPLVPLQDSPPTLPSPGPIPARPVALPRTAPFGADFASRTGQEWLVETYVYPAAHPRSLLGATKSRRSDDDGLDLADSPRAGTPPPPAPPTRLSKEEIAKKLGDLMQARTQAMRDSDRHDFERDFQDRNPLWIAANRYYRASSGRARRPAATPASAAGQQGITLVVAHANGFSKETWEPMFASLIAGAAAGGLEEPIEEIWSLDMVNQGDSAVLNKGVLGENFDWSDNGRDILQFVLSYLPEYDGPSSSEGAKARLGESAQGTAPSWTTENCSISQWNDSNDGQAAGAVAASSATAGLSASASAGVSNANPLEYDRRMVGYITEDASLASTAKPASTASPLPFAPSNANDAFMPKVLRKQPLPADFQDALRLDKSASSALSNLGKPLASRRWRHRRIVLLGHSVGAAGMIYTSSTFPQLFEKTVLVDPTVYPHTTNKLDGTNALTMGAIIRREAWKDREEAYTLFAKNKGFYGKWDKDSLAGFVHFGLVPSKDGKTVELKVDRMQEAYVYADAENYGSKRAFHRLALIPRSLGLHIVRGDVGQSVIPEDVYPAFREISKHATHARVKNAGHLIAQEKPKGLAAELARYLNESSRKIEHSNRARL